MDREKGRELEIMNDNLKTIVKNQMMIYCLLKEMEEKLVEKKAEQ